MGIYQYTKIKNVHTLRVFIEDPLCTDSVLHTMSRYICEVMDLFHMGKIDNKQI